MNLNEIPNEVKELKQWLAQEKGTLAAAGVTNIVGNIPVLVMKDSSMVSSWLAPTGPSNYKLPLNVQELIERVTDIVAMPGYENNDGGGGSITLDVETGAIVHASYDLMVDRYDYPEVCY